MDSRLIQLIVKLKKESWFLKLLNRGFDPLQFAKNCPDSISVEQRQGLSQYLELYPKIQKKWPEFEGTPVLDRLAYEQSTSQILAQYKADLITATQIQGIGIDICCGAGADSWYWPQNQKRLGLDLSSSRLAMYQHNKRAAKAQGIRADVCALPLNLSQGGFWHCDPDRRAQGSDSQWDHKALVPSQALLQSWLKLNANALIKLPPSGWSWPGFQGDLHFLGTQKSCLELLLKSGCFTSESPRIIATHCESRDSISATKQQLGALQFTCVTEEKLVPGMVLSEPSPVAIRSGLYKLFSEQGYYKIHQDFPYLIAQKPYVSPFLNHFKVLEILPSREKELFQHIKAQDLNIVSVKKRGLDFAPETWLKKLNKKKLKGKPSLELICMPSPFCEENRMLVFLVQRLKLESEKV